MEMNKTPPGQGGALGEPIDHQSLKNHTDLGRPGQLKSPWRGKGELISSLGVEAMSAATSMRTAHLRSLASSGCLGPMVALGAIQPGLGFAEIEATGSGYYAPCDGGIPAFTLPVCTWDEVGPIVTDIIAWPIGKSSAWFWRTGTAWALGENQIMTDEPLVVHATPQDWLAAGSLGLCVLDWSERSPAWQELRCQTTLQPTSTMLAKRLTTGLMASLPLPRMEVLHAA